MRKQSQATHCVEEYGVNRQPCASLTNRCAEELRGPDWPLLTTKSSVDGKDAMNLGNVFAVLKPIGEHAKCEGFGFR